MEALASLQLHEFAGAATLLEKILGNVLDHDDAKYRSLPRSNAKVAALLKVDGVFGVLMGCGFVEGADALTLACAADRVQMAHHELVQLMKRKADAERKAISDQKQAWPAKKAAQTGGKVCSACAAAASGAPKRYIPNFGERIRPGTQNVPVALFSEFGAFRTVCRFIITSRLF